MSRDRKPSEMPERRASRRHARNRRRIRLLLLSVASLVLVSLSSLILSSKIHLEASQNNARPHPSVAEKSPASLAAKQTDKPQAGPNAGRRVKHQASEDSGARFDAEALRSRLVEDTREYPGFYGVVVYDTTSKKSVGLNQDEYFTAASLAKLPVLLTLYREASRGELGLDAGISILPTDVQAYGSGVLQNYPVGSKMTIRQCAKYLIKYSDNTAWVMLERILDHTRIDATLTALGDRDADYGSYVMTPEDALLSLKAVNSREFTDPKLSEEMLGFMTDTAYEDRLPYPLPQGTKIAHKIGTYGDTFSDAGIVFYKDRRGKEKTYYIVVMSSGATEETARTTIRKVSLDTYEAIAKKSSKTDAQR